LLKAFAAKHLGVEKQADITLYSINVKSAVISGSPRATKSEASDGLPRAIKAKHPLASPFLRGTGGGSKRGTEGGSEGGL
jgi:hypothetical protein